MTAFTHIGMVFVRHKLNGDARREFVLLYRTADGWTNGRQRWCEGHWDAEDSWQHYRLLLASIREATAEELAQHAEDARAKAVLAAHLRVDRLKRELRYADEEVVIANTKRQSTAVALQEAETQLAELDTF